MDVLVWWNRYLYMYICVCVYLYMCYSSESVIGRNGFQADLNFQSCVRGNDAGNFFLFNSSG